MTSTIVESPERQALIDAHNEKIEILTRKRIYTLKEASYQRLIQKAIVAKCREDIVFFANTFIVAFNPRVRPSTLPFICFEKQEEFLIWAKGLKDKSYVDKTRNYWGACVKSRYTGASVLCCILLLHAWLFDRDFSGAIGSRKAELVYNAGNPDALFSKLIHMLEKLPSWLTPKYTFKRNLLTNNINGNTIKGEAGVNIGRGGRSSVYVLDEAAFIEQSQLVVAALSENTDCVLMISTPNGTNNFFYQAYKNPTYPKFKITWRDDPRRTMEWYHQQCEKFDASIVAQELDCDFMATQSGVIIPGKFIPPAIECQSVLNVRSTQHYRNIYAGFDPAGEGKDSNVLIIRHGIEVTDIYEWRGLDTTQSAEKVINLCLDHNVCHLSFDVGGVGNDLAGTLKSRRRRDRSMQDKLFTFSAIHFGQKPSEYYWDESDMTSQDRFSNTATEIMYLLRERFFKTYQMVNELREYPLDELICIPDNGKLIDQLMVYTSEVLPSGKIRRISKEKLRENGISSPDHADALALCFYSTNVFASTDIY